jgi:hypothetical protein
MARPTKMAAVALANKTGRRVWALMTGKERSGEPVIARNETRGAVADKVGKRGQELVHEAG